MARKNLRKSQIKNDQSVPHQTSCQKNRVEAVKLHFKLERPKSNSKMSHHSKNPGYFYSKSIVLSGSTTPISLLRQDSAKSSMRTSKNKNK